MTTIAPPRFFPDIMPSRPLGSFVAHREIFNTRLGIMSGFVVTLTQRLAWQALEAHYPKVQAVHLRQLFADDPTRGERLTTEAIGIYFDYAKHRITDETLTLLLQLAAESGLRSRIDAMFRGDKINVTEKRAVLHIAPSGKLSIVVQPCVKKSWLTMSDLFDGAGLQWITFL